MAVPPLVILIVGVVTVLSLIIVLRIHAFLALITAAMVVSLLAPGPVPDRISRVGSAFGGTAAEIGVVIAMAAVIGRCLIESGAADRIVRMFVGLLGEKRCPVSLMSSGFVLSVPVFFDTVFYLLLPLARSMHRRTKKSYVLLILSMGAGASITHSLVPPTPGPLLIADRLDINLGMMIMVGVMVAVCTAVVTLVFIRGLSRLIEIPMRPLEGDRPEPEPLPDKELPGLFVSLLPILLPVVLISSQTVMSTLAEKAASGSLIMRIEGLTAIVGDPDLAMLFAAAAALSVLWRQRGLSLQELAEVVESSLLGGGVIILITCAGGAFGDMLEQANVGSALQGLLVSDSTQVMQGIGLLWLAFLVAFVIKFAQGSSTVAMITASAMLATLLGTPEEIGFHHVYVACAIGFGAQCGNWMNDSGFWIFAKMSGLTEVETLKTWTVTVSTLAVVGLLFTMLFATILPLI